MRFDEFFYKRSKFSRRLAFGTVCDYAFAVCGCFRNRHACADLCFEDSCPELFRDYLWEMGKPNNIPRDWFDWWTQEMVNQSDWIE